jgi:DNA invertase Pin-like site-specific DNA recombinase
MRANSPAKSRAIGYIRVSTEQQAESGLGLDAQQVSIDAAASRLGLELSRTFVDAGTSGKLAIEDRPVLLDAVAALKRGDVLLVAKRDRLGRDVIAVAMIERLIAKRGARVVSAAGEGTDSDDPAALLMRRLIDSLAEYERALIAARTRAALGAKRRRGERVSGIIPFGFRLGADGRTLDVHVDEQATLTTIQTLRAAGTPLRAITDALNAEGKLTRAGTPWLFEYVRRALKQLRKSEQPAA